MPHLSRTFALLFVLFALSPGMRAGDLAVPFRLNSTVDKARAQQGDIKVYFRNNVGWFKPIQLIVFRPGDERGKVEARVMLPWQRFSMRLPEGTKIYISSNEQVERWQEGADIRKLPASMTIRKSDEGELYNLFR